MDGQTTNKPDWLAPGAFVKVQHWYGIIEDVAVSPARIMVLVKSPKGVWRNQRDASEWLEYIEDQIVPADKSEIEREVEVHVKRVQQMLKDLDAFKNLTTSKI
jgi:hypothetical protein